MKKTDKPDKKSTPLNNPKTSLPKKSPKRDSSSVSITTNSAKKFPQIMKNLDMSNQSFHHPNVQLMGMPGMGVGNSPNMQLNMPNNIHPHYMSMMNGNMGVPNLDFTSEETGENIKVCIRIRPMNATEQGRGDGKCVEYINSSSLQLKNKNINKSYSFNIVFGDGASQEDVFYSCSVNKLVENALNGYSVTIFAYGQTGSGKTYTIMGRDDAINEQVLNNDHYTGLIPKAIKYIWSVVGKSGKNEKIFIKASFLEIYNEQINDLLNPKNTNLQIRWNQKQGFFVEGLSVIDCKQPSEIVEVLLEGHKNRKIGSHDLNKDSSRSHCILTIYVISEFQSDGQNFKKYGKISFVDLAGSERLKESKSQGEMIKETGNINKSLFVLGKVISSLTDKKNNKQHIPYRDSKLTMLLMDSIGGTAKTLMIACISPSQTYADETMSTLNYASRTMNITNKPIVQMDSKEQIIVSLKKENDYLKLENEFLKNEFIKLTGTYPSMTGNMMGNGNVYLPPINNFKIGMDTNNPNMNSDNSDELEKIKEENFQLKKAKETTDRQNTNLINENMILASKLNNLENVFIGSKIVRNKDGSVSNDMGEDYNMSAVMLENSELKKNVDRLELEKAELKDILSKKDNPGKQMLKDDNEINELREHNSKLNRRVEFLQKRERELLETIMKLKNEKK